MSLLPGGEYGGMTSGQPALTNNNETVIVLGYCSNWRELKEYQKEYYASGKMRMLKEIKITPAFVNQK